MEEVGAVVQAARVVEEGEEADDGFVSSGFFGECEAGILDPLPMVGTVDRAWVPRITL